MRISGCHVEKDFRGLHGLTATLVQWSEACHSEAVPAGLKCELQFSRSFDGAVADPLLQRYIWARMLLVSNGYTRQLVYSSTFN